MLAGVLVFLLSNLEGQDAQLQENHIRRHPAIHSSNHQLQVVLIDTVNHTWQQYDRCSISMDGMSRIKEARHRKQLN